MQDKYILPWSYSRMRVRRHGIDSNWEISGILSSCSKEHWCVRHTYRFFRLKIFRYFRSLWNSPLLLLWSNNSWITIPPHSARGNCKGCWRETRTRLNRCTRIEMNSSSVFWDWQTYPRSAQISSLAGGELPSRKVSERRIIKWNIKLPIYCIRNK